MYRCLYYLYLDESGTSNTFHKLPINTEEYKCKFFTLAGIVVHETDITRFNKSYDSILATHFNCQLPKGFKLHYEELRNAKLRNGNSIYKRFSDNQKKAISDCIFTTIINVPCYLLSITINLHHHYNAYISPISPLSYSLYLIEERFQYFLEEIQEMGEIIYERYSKNLKDDVTQTHSQLNANPNFPTLTDFANIRNVKDGNPIDEFMLSFAYFFAYIPWLKCFSCCKKVCRYNDVRHKYYNLDHWDWHRRGNYEI